MKVEMFELILSEGRDISDVINGAIRTMSAVAGHPLPLKVIETEDGWDLELLGIEVGSYGIRRIGDVQYMYGTGLAEPRFGQVLSMLEGVNEE
jgi:hypothetical protein